MMVKMGISEQFYYQDQQSEKLYTNKPPGTLDVGRFIKGQPCWANPGVALERKKKTLIIADWTAEQWSREEMFGALSHARILIHTGFTLYIYSNGVLKPLTLDNISDLSSPIIRHPMCPTFPEAIFQTAAKELGLPKDKIQIVDGFAFKALQEHPIATRQISLSNWIQTGHDNDEIMAIIRQTGVDSLVYDEFSSRANSAVQHLPPDLQNLQKVVHYHTLNLRDQSGLIIHELLTAKEIQLKGEIFKRSQLADIETLDVSGIDMTFPQLGEMLAKTTGIKKLILSKCQNLQGDFDIPDLPNLTELDVSDSNISAENLNLLLRKAPKLNRLILSGSPHLIEDINMLHLPKLQQLEISDDISSKNIEKLMESKANFAVISFSRSKIAWGNIGENISQLDDEGIKKFTSLAQSASGLMPGLNNVLHFLLNVPLSQLEETGHVLMLKDALMSDGEKLRDSVQPPHNAANRKHFKPTPQDASFHYRGINKTKNQGMIIEKLSQYLTLTGLHVQVIPKLQDGICSALTRYYNQQTNEEWSAFVEEVSVWNGKQESLSETVKGMFEDLFDNYVKTYQFDITQQHGQYLGENLQAFLRSAEKKAYVLASPWHAISIKPSPDNHSWLLYDPNYAKGAIEVGPDELLSTIQQILGKVISVESEHELNPGMVDHNQFMEKGGLIALSQCKNASAMLAQMTPIPDFSRNALDGILLRDLGGIPAWVNGIECHKTVSAYTALLLVQFIHKNPNDYEDQLQKSMALLSPQERHFCMERILKLFPVDGSDNQRSKLIGMLRTAGSVQHYNQRLQTWEKNKPAVSSVSAYCQELVRPHDHKKRLIELDSTEAVNAMQLSVQAHCKTINRPVFYINSPEELICSAPFVKRVGEESVLTGGPGGRLYDFLQMPCDPANPPILLVNYEHFTDADLVRFNSLLDGKRVADGTPLPKATEVIGLLNRKKPDCYQGADFYSRFDQIEICPFDTSALALNLNVMPLREKMTGEDLTTINLYHAADWEKRLLDHYVFKSGKLMFEQGAWSKAKAAGKTIEILNGPWESQSFRDFWQGIDARNTPVVKSEGYDWPALTAFVTCENGFIPNAEVLNPSQLSRFFEEYQCNNDLKTLDTLPGIIANHAGQPLHVNLTREMDEDAWAMLLDACNQQQVRLMIHRAPSVSLPPSIADPVPQEDSSATPWDGQISKSTQLIQSHDVDATVAMICQHAPSLVLNISACELSDLLSHIQGELNKENLKFEFTESQRALILALEQDKQVILKGEFSETLTDSLAAFILKRQHAPGPLGKLVLVTEKPNAFSYLAVETHQVDSNIKLTCLNAKYTQQEISRLPAEILEKEPLRMLEGRLNYYRANPDAHSSDNAWQGIAHLPGGIKLAPFILEDSQLQSLAFQAARLEQVNAILKHAPYVFLTGLTSVGKSTFVEKTLCQDGSKLFQGEAKICEWALDLCPGRKILFIDEANIGNRKWSEFEGLFDIPPGILIDGVYHHLTPEHKVVFAGNPLSYGDERQLDPFFARHGNALVFEPLPAAFIYEEILKPVFAGSNLSPQEGEISMKLLEIYRFLCECSKDEVLISPRELQMMALLVLSHHHKLPSDNPIDIAAHHAYHVAKNVVPARDRARFERQFKPANDWQEREKSPNLNGSNFLITESRKLISTQLDDLLALREYRLSHGINEAQQYGGLGGTIIEGEPGIGKSELVTASLRARGYQEMHHFDLPATSDKPFYRMPVSMQIEDKTKLLLKAFHEGAVVLIDEINSSPMMERLLNDLLMGKTPDGKRPLKPGFMVIGTQNPITMGGRRATSTALSRRLLSIYLPPYHEHEMKSILMLKGLDETETNRMVKVYQEKVAYAQVNRLTPAPTFRDLIRLSDEVIEAQRKSTPKIKAEPSLSSNSFTAENNPLTQPGTEKTQHLPPDASHETNLPLSPRINAVLIGAIFGLIMGIFFPPAMLIAPIVGAVGGLVLGYLSHSGYPRV